MVNADAASPARWRRYGPLAVLMAGLATLAAGLVATGGDLQRLAAPVMALRAFSETHPWLAGLSFLVIYAGLAAIAAPGVLWLTLVGGALFGWAQGAVTAWIGGTIGAVILFLAVRNTGLSVQIDRWGPRAAAIRDGLDRDGVFYIFAARVLPTPFFLVNLAAGASGMALRRFAAGTVLGLIPASIAYAALGAGAGAVLASGDALSLNTALRPDIATGFLLLGAMALAAPWIRRARKRRHADVGLPRR